MTLLLRRAIAAAACALALSGCVDSAEPVLTNPQPWMNRTIRLQFFSQTGGLFNDPEAAVYEWNGVQYAHASGGLADIKAFVIHPYPFQPGYYVLQSVPEKRGETIEYALMHEIARNVYWIAPIDEDDSDDETRAKYCQRVERSACRVTTREQLLALARATAALPPDKGALAVRLPSDTDATKK